MSSTEEAAATAARAELVSRSKQVGLLLDLPTLPRVDRTSEHDLERIKALRATDITHAKTQVAQRSALLAELLAGHEPEAAA